MKERFKIGSGRRLRVLLFAAVAVGSAGIAIAAYATDALQSQDLNTINTRFSIRGTQKPGNIVVVGVDVPTLGALAQYTWPYPRAVDGRVINNIAAQHPKAIAVDIQFNDRSAGTPAAAQSDELALLNAVNNSKSPLVFSFTTTNGHGAVTFLGSPQGNKLLSEVGARPANGLFPPDPGGVYRRMEYQIGGLPTLAIATAEVATHKRVGRGAFGSGSAWIDYAGPTNTYPEVSFSNVYANHIPSNYFRGKIVVLGATAAVIQDVHPTSTDSLMSGPEVQANAIDTVLRGFPLASVPGWVNIVLIILLAAAVPLISLRVRPIFAILFAVGLGIAFAVAVQLAFNAGWIVSFIYPLGALILAAVGSLAVQLITEAFERLRTRDLFTRFVPEDVVDEVLKSSDGLRLGGAQRDSTVMFTDLRGFTSFSESLTPAQVIEVLNHYLSEMSDAILDHGGTLVAYMGDGIFAVFGAPLQQDNHADRALATAREMLEVRLPRFNEWIHSEGLGDGFRMGIGLNSGFVMSGHVGSERRVEYAAVGDTTNTASRIESMTKGTPHQLLLSDSTRDALHEPADDLVFFEEVEIRGRVNRMKLWGLKEPEPASEEPAEAAHAPEPVS